MQKLSIAQHFTHWTNSESYRESTGTMILSKSNSFSIFKYSQSISNWCFRPPRWSRLICLTDWAISNTYSTWWIFSLDSFRCARCPHRFPLNETLFSWPRSKHSLLFFCFYVLSVRAEKLTQVLKYLLDNLNWVFRGRFCWNIVHRVSDKYTVVYWSFQVLSCFVGCSYSMPGSTH